MKGLARFIRYKPVTISMSFVTLLILGVLAAFQIPLQLLPSGMENAYLWVTVGGASSSPEENERAIAQVVEDYLATLAHVKSLSSFSGSGRVSLSIQYDEGTDMAAAYSALRSKLDHVSLALPEEVDRPRIDRFDADEIPILFYVLTLDDFYPFRDALLQTIKSEIEAVEGVGKVEVSGGGGAKVMIDLNMSAVRALRINLQQVQKRLKALDAKSALGQVSFSGTLYYVRAVSGFSSLQALREVVIDSHQGTTLNDIAHVYLRTDRDRRSIRHVDGKRGFRIRILKSSSANTIATSQRVEDAIKKMTVIHRDAHLRTIRIFSQAKIIKEALLDLIKNALLGGVISFIVLFLFLKDFANTFIISLSIPFSLLLTVMVMHFLGQEINVVSLIGLMLCIGMVVDNAIVVMESILRSKRGCSSAVEAAVKGVSNVGIAVFTATSTTVIVFLPLVLMKKGSMFSFFMIKLGVPVCVALLASLLIALVYVPTWMSRGGKRNEQKNASIEALTIRYRHWLISVLRWRWLSFFIAIVLLASMAYPIMEQRSATAGLKIGGSRVRITTRFSKQFDAQDRRRVFLAIEHYLLTHKKEYFVERVIADLSAGKRRGRYSLYLDEKRFKDSGGVLESHKLKLMHALKERFDTPGLTIGRTLTQSRVNERGKVDLHIIGDSFAGLESVVDKIRERLLRLDHVRSVASSFDSGNDYQYVFSPNRAATWALKTDSGRIAATIRSFLERKRMGYLDNDHDQKIAIEMGVPKGTIETIEDLESVEIEGEVGRYPLVTLGKFELQKAPRRIRRHNRKISIKLVVSTDEVDLTRFAAEIFKGLQDYQFPPGYALDLGEQFDKQNDDARDLLFAATLSVVFVFLLMGILFESALLPFIIVSTLPSALLGAEWLKWLSSTPSDVMSKLGLVLLVGIVVNNGIILVDRIERLRRGGTSLGEAVVRGCQSRFRPIIMTACTTISGVFPMILFGRGAIGFDYQSLGITVIGGLLSATVFTLFFVPIIYMIMMTLKNRLYNFFIMRFSNISMPKLKRTH